MKISNVDSNLKVEKSVEREDVVWRSAKEGMFDLYGLLYTKEEPGFYRIPAQVAKETSEGVYLLNTNTAGGRIRFKTDSPYIAIRAEMSEICHFPHMPLSGTSGFDLYGVENGVQTYLHTFMPPFEMKYGYESLAELEGSRGCREYVINFPLYNDVQSLEIGLQEGASVQKGEKYRNKKPVVFYGSSITQGGCASRPGNCYQNFISRHYNLDYVNLGFSGSGKAEEAIVSYMSGLDMIMFVSDYDYNAPDPEYLENTHFRMYQRIREKQPEVPYVMICNPAYEKREEENIQRRDIIFQTYRKARDRGDKNVYFIDGYTLFGGQDRDACTVDRTHPNDLGFYRMSQVIGNIVSRNYRD